MRFHKMHGLGNDFVVIDAREAPVEIDADRARFLADRHLGIGCDQLVLLGPADDADVSMRLWNADGSEVGACGNATRCVPVLLGRDVLVRTAAGLLDARLADDGAAVDMGMPATAWDAIPLAYPMDTAALPLAWDALKAPVAVNVGNPHLVFFVDDVDAVALVELGPAIETDPAFPERINVNVAAIAAPDRVRMRTWERGAGLTRACGTGACATFAAGRRLGRLAPSARIDLPGGRLTIAERDGRLLMTGPATHVFSGEIAVTVATLGCRLNIAESAAIAAMIGRRDDVAVVNSCAVTAEALADTRRAIRRLRRERPTARLLVTGCAVETDGSALAAMPEVDGLVSNLSKHDPAAFGLAAATDAAPATHARAFIPVQTGCDHACTFCIIPTGRGPSRSLPAGAVLDAVDRAVDGGAREVVLTGVDLTSYGPDLPGAPPLGLLVERILAHRPGLARLRLSSLDAPEIDDRLFALVTQEPRVMPHLHLSLQSGDDMILKRMKRRHSRGQAIALIERLKAARPEIVIGADLIAGFPTETDEMAANSLALVDDGDIVLGHVFPYSPRPGTPAARMPQLPRETIRARAARLRARSAERRRDWLATLVDSTQRLLVERDGRTGHTEGFARVRLATPTVPNSIQTVRILAADDQNLSGIIA